LTAVTLACGGGHASCADTCGQLRCGALCVDDALADDDNCGACGRACDVAGGQSCVVGVAGAADNVCGCTDARAPDLCGTSCVSLATDERNCGACGHVCAGSSVCAPSPFRTAGACACADDGDCVAGERCAFGVCAAGVTVATAGGVVVAHVDGDDVVFCDLTVAQGSLLCAELGFGPAIGPLLATGAPPVVPDHYARVTSCAAGDSLLSCEQSLSSSSCLPSGVACVANDSAAEIDFCDVPSATQAIIVASGGTATLTSRLREQGVTTTNVGRAPGVRAQFGFKGGSTSGDFADYAFHDAVFASASPGGDTNLDEYTFSVRQSDGFVGVYRYVFRYSLDDGLSWTYCDADGAGGGSGFSFASAGTVTLN
jgi:hypothetical protein